MRETRTPRRETDVLLARAADYFEFKADLDRRKGEYTGYSGGYYFAEDNARLDRMALDFEDAVLALVNTVKAE